MPMWLLLLLVPALGAAVTVSTDFEGGSLGRIEKVSETHFRLGARGEKDQDGRNRQANWYYFRVDDAGHQKLTLDIVDLPGEYNYRPNQGAITKDTPPLISYDRRTWKHIETFTYDPKEPKLTLHVTPSGPRFWIAHVPPYTGQDLERLRAEAARHSDFREEKIGKTLGGRDVVLWTIATPPLEGKPTVWLMFRQHSWETGSSWAGEGAVRALLRDDEKSRLRRRNIVWKIFPLCDPDGVARGGVRFNAKGYDLNRNWDVEDRAKMPEIAAQRDAVRAWVRGGHTIALFFSLHNTETGEYLEGPPQKGGEGKFQPLAERFFRILSESTTFAPTQPLRYADVTTTAGMTGRMTVVQGLYRDLKIPAFLMEQRISYNPKLGHLPEIPDRMKFGAELVDAIAQAVRPEVRQALEHIRTHQQEQIDKQIAIAQIPAPPFKEAARAKAMADEFRRVRLRDVEIDGIGNVLGWVPGASPRALVVAAHLDTVFPEGTDVTVKRSGSRLIGPGLNDDTRGLTALLGIADALAAASIRPRHSLLFVADVGEEGLGDLRGIKYLLREGKYRDRVDAFISIDGDGTNRIVNREMGSRRYRVTVSGPGGHSYLNFGRANSAHALGRIIAHLSDMQVPVNPKTTYNVGRIGGGTSVNSIPFESWMEFDMRSEEEEPLVKLEQEFLQMARKGVEEENRLRAPSETKVTLDAKLLATRHAVSSPKNAGLVQAAREAAAALGLAEPALYTGSTDSNAAMSAGIPAITIDGGGRAGNLHSLEEWFEPEGAYVGIQKALLTILLYDEKNP